MMCGCVGLSQPPSFAHGKEDAIHRPCRLHGKTKMSSVSVEIRESKHLAPLPAGRPATLSFKHESVYC